VDGVVVVDDANDDDNVDDEQHAAVHVDPAADVVAAFVVGDDDDEHNDDTTADNELDNVHDADGVDGLDDGGVDVDVDDHPMELEEEVPRRKRRCCWRRKNK
jgi:hypothetical protein